MYSSSTIYHQHVSFTISLQTRAFDGQIM